MRESKARTKLDDSLLMNLPRYMSDLIFQVTEGDKWRISLFQEFINKISRDLIQDNSVKRVSQNTELMNTPCGGVKYQEYPLQRY